MKMIHNPKILILADHSVFSYGVKCILENTELEVLGIVHHWKELFENLLYQTPHVILLNLLPYNGTFIECLEKLKNEYPHIPIVPIIKEGSIDFFKKFILLGISGFVFSDITPSELIKAINRAIKGKEYFPEGIFTMVKETLEFNSENLHQVSYKVILTSRESSICKLFCKGMTYKEIGAELYISPRTVETHKKNILSKLKIKSTADMVRYALQHQLI